MIRRLIVAVVVLALGGGSLGLAQALQDPHIGTWKLNIAKSKLNPQPTNPPPQSAIRTYEPFEGDGIKATFVTITADGKRVTSSYSARFDEKEYPYTGNPNLTSIALKRVDANTWAATNKGPGKLANTGTNTVSKDGKTLTWTFKGTNAEGLPVGGVQVYEKQ